MHENAISLILHRPQSGPEQFPIDLNRDQLCRVELLRVTRGKTLEVLIDIESIRNDESKSVIDPLAAVRNELRRMDRD